MSDRIADWLRHGWRIVVPQSADDAIVKCCLLGVMTIACLMPIQNDTWWHLRAGEEMWSRRIVMLTDEFSFTTTGAPWPNHEWLTEVVFYAIYYGGGLPGLTLFAASAVTTALVLSWRLMAGPPMPRFLITAIALTAIVPVWTVRPHVFTLVLLMTVIHLALRERYWPIPLLFVVWANLHGGVAMGLVALGGAAVGTVIASGFSRIKPLIVVGVLSFAATFVTPLGVALWTTIPESIHKSTMNQISEWRRASLFGSEYVAFWVAAALLPITSWMSRRAIRTKDHIVLVAVAFALLPLALRYSRNIPPFLLVAIPALTRTLAPWFREARTSRSKPTPSANAALVLICAVACSAVVAIAWRTPAPRLEWQPIPAAVVKEIEACSDRPYNTYTEGGYLIWFARGVRVFIDSRQDPYPLAFLQDYIENERTGNYKATFRRYGITCAVLPDSSPTATRLLADGWRTRVHMGRWLVLERQGAGGMDQSRGDPALRSTDVPHGSSRIGGTERAGEAADANCDATTTG